jgi:hypothetical protein
MNARAFGSQSFHPHTSEPAPRPEKPRSAIVEQWNAQLGRFVELRLEWDERSSMYVDPAGRRAA